MTRLAPNLLLPCLALALAACASPGPADTGSADAGPGEPWTLQFDNDRVVVPTVTSISNVPLVSASRLAPEDR